MEWWSKLVWFCASGLVLSAAETRGQTAVTAARMAEAKTAMAAGARSAGQGDLKAAEREFARAVELAPSTPATHAALGAVFLAEEKVASSAKELETARRMAPADVGVALNLARIRVAQGRFRDAVTLFRGAEPGAELSPDEEIAYATALSGLGDDPEAERVLRGGLQRTPDSAELHDTLGSVLATGEHLEEALLCFRRALELEPGMARAEYHLGVALAGLGKNAEALTALEAAAKAMPASFDVHLQLGRALSAEHRDAEALAELRRAASMRARAPRETVYQLALALQASGDPAGALPLFAEVVAGDGATTSALTNWALARVQTGDAAGALPLYAKALAQGPDSPTLREDFGAAFLQQNDLAHALEQFRAGLSLDGDNAHLHYDLGVALKLKDDLASAVPEFQKAAELDPSLPDPAYTLGVILMQQGRSAEAAAQLRRAVELQPENGDAWALLGSVLKDAGDAAGATDALQRAIVLEPEVPSLHIQLAAMKAAAGDRQGAAEERRIAVELSRAAITRQKASFALKSGRALLGEGRIPEAVIQLRAAAEADPKAAEPHLLLAEAYRRQGDPAAAAEQRQAAELVKAAK